MANLGQRIWIWKVNQEVDAESVIAKGYIAAGEKHKDIGDFFQYNNRDELLDAIDAQYGSRQYSRAAQSYINMMYEAAIGDIVAICKIESQKHYLYGWGIISGGCEYLKDENNPIRILVDWHEPILKNPILADRLSDNEVFTATDEAQAAQVISLLQINENETMEQAYLQDYIDLLKANHNIILNGAPGTGKTYLAKQIAEVMGKADCAEGAVVYRKPNRISSADILQYLSPGLSILSSKGRAEYKIVKVENGKVYLDSSTILGYAVPFDEIINAYEVQLWRGGQRNGYDSYSAALAKYIYEQLSVVEVNHSDLKQVSCNYKLVQFHPSYDYTDFVEGLRPVKDGQGNIGFERKDGVFKEFCKKALGSTYMKKVKNQYVSKEILSSEMAFASLYEQLKNRIKSHSVVLYSDFRNTQKQMNVKVEDGDIKFEKGGNIQRAIPSYVEKIFNFYRRNNTSDIRDTRFDDYTKIIGNTIDYSYYRGIVQELLNMARILPKEEVKETPVSPVVDNADIQERNPFVFIIDEINRGEISKIFGELFFSIDPGYRGEKGKVQTQYQNLVEDGDVFKDGFFVPENVYIIGTMNDIDRSVESMDFAMRRRFAWHEVTAEESAKNMKIEGELLERMNRLNQVIGETEGLGCAYHVGGAMFLKVQDGEMTVESLWNLNLKSLMKEYLRGLPDADETLKKMEDAYFLKGTEGMEPEAMSDNEE